MAIGLAMSTYAQGAKFGKQHRGPESQAIQVTVVVQCPCQHQAMGPRQHMFGGPRDGFRYGPRAMNRPREMTAPQDREQREWNKTLGARQSEMRHQLNPSGPYPDGRKGFGPPRGGPRGPRGMGVPQDAPTNHVEAPKGE